MLAPRLSPPGLAEIEQRLGEIPWEQNLELPEELLVFYHPTTLQHLCSLRKHLLRGHLDQVDRWIQMVALTRLADAYGAWRYGSTPDAVAADVPIAARHLINRILAE